MARTATVPATQEATAPSGNALLVSVIIGTVFLLFMAFLNVVKPPDGGAGS